MTSVDNRLGVKQERPVYGSLLQLDPESDRDALWLRFVSSWWSLPLYLWAFPITLLTSIFALAMWAAGQFRPVRRTGLVFEWVIVGQSRTYELLKNRWGAWSGCGNVVYLPEGLGYKALRVHELRHTFQMYVLGVLMPILYVIFLVVIWFVLHPRITKFFTERKFHAYLDNPFERDARRAAGQKVDIPSDEWRDGPDDRWPWW